MKHLLAIDPGSEKTGTAVLTGAGQVLEKKRIRTVDLEVEFRSWCEKYRDLEIILGDRTGSRDFLKRLQAPGVLPEGTPIHLVNEHLSTQEARQRYFRENPPRGWRRLIPLTLQTPPQPVDEYVAVILAERFLSSHDLRLNS